jgi:RNA-binding protein
VLSKADKKLLRKNAQALRPIVQVGKDGIGENMIRSLNNALEARELVKCTLLKTSPVGSREAAIECAGRTHSEIIQIIGHTFVLYRRSDKNIMGLKK